MAINVFISVFISCDKENKNSSRIAKKLYNDLKQLGIEVWLDTENIEAGQNWEYEISSAIKRCSHFLAILSLSLSNKGFVHKELKLALDILEQFPPTSEVFIIPVHIEACDPTYQSLRKLKPVKIYSDSDYAKGFNQILKVLSPQKKEFKKNKFRKINVFSICLIVTCLIILYFLYIPFIVIEVSDSKNQCKLSIYSVNPQKYIALVFRDNGGRYGEIPIADRERNEIIKTYLFSKTKIIKYSHQQNETLVAVLINNPTTTLSR
ncbi:MAG: toll/interleukin-1 receptor domain-containing protein [Desulfobacteraceae bacterium]|nr:toll/interleukin-1 receptor domain-containing protein [Desulfobacteraceae bacterium]